MDADQRARRERRLRRVVDEGLRGCPPMTVDEVRDVARDAGETLGVPRERVDDIVEQAQRGR
jgi:hypothetical protein